jgi:hypothetical protein
VPPIPEIKTGDTVATDTNNATSTQQKSNLQLDEFGKEVLKKYEKEIAAYQRELPRLLTEGEEGRYALIKGDEILSVWDTDGDAIQAGIAKFGLEPICVKKIKARDSKPLDLLLNLKKDSSCPS